MGYIKNIYVKKKYLIRNFAEKAAGDGVIANKILN